MRTIDRRRPVSDSDFSELSAPATGTGRVRTLNMDSAFLVTSVPMAAGVGLRLTIALPHGVRIVLLAHVAKVTAEPSPHPWGVAVQFYDLDDATRGALRAYLTSADGQRTEHGNATIAERYRLKVGGGGILHVSLTGAMRDNECAMVEAGILRAVQSWSYAALKVCINATHYECSSAEAVVSLQRCFAFMNRGFSLVGALVGPPSLGMLQIRRAAREAAVADSVVSF